MKIERRDTPTSWMVSRQEIREKFPALRAAFLAWLNIYRRQAVILADAGPALTALAREIPELEKVLGKSFLALALGGSLIRGLGTVQTSDVDYYIYTRQVGGRLADAVRDGSWQRLRHAGLTPCDDYPVVSLDPGQVHALEAALGVFTNHLVYEREPGLSRRLALRMIGELLGSMDTGDRLRLGQMIRADYDTLMHNNADYAARKFLKNRAIPLVGERVGAMLDRDQPSLAELTALAEPVMAERQRLFPLPADLEQLLVK